jgi:EmrB/QacA subfamily drug resistance transporter
MRSRYHLRGAYAGARAIGYKECVEPVPSASWRVLRAVAAGSFTSALGASLVNVTNPLIRAHFHAAIGEVSWVIAGYLLALSVLLVPAGRLGDVWGHARTFRAGLVGFGAAALACAAAPTLGALLAARVAQGSAAALVMASGPAMVSNAFPPAERGRALGLQATFTYVGLTLGPTVGGVLGQAFAWRAVFFVLAPATLVPLVLAAAVPPTPAPAATAAGQARPRFDWIGAALFGGVIAAVLFGLQRIDTRGGRTAALGPTLGLLALGAGIALAFARHLRTAAHPVVPAALFRERAFSFGVVAALAQYASLFVVSFLLPFHLAAWGFAPRAIGLVLAVQPLVMAVVAPLSGAASDRIGPRRPATIGMLVLALGIAVVGRAPVGATVVVDAGLAVMGLGSGLFATPNNSAILAVARRGAAGSASGMLAVARSVGMATGVAVGTSAFGAALAWIGADAAFGVALYAGIVIAAIGALASWIGLPHAAATR